MGKMVSAFDSSASWVDVSRREIESSYIYINLWKLTLRGHLNTDDQARDRTRNFLLTRTMPCYECFLKYVMA